MDDRNRTPEALYDEAAFRQANIERVRDALDAAALFERLGDFRDAAARAAACRDRAAELQQAQDQAQQAYRQQRSELNAERDREQVAVQTQDRRHKKVLVLVIGIAAALVLIAAVLFFVINGVTGPADTYRQAVAAMDAGDMDAAVPLLVKLQDYRDSADRLEQILLPQAQAISGLADVTVATSLDQPWFAIDTDGALRFRKAFYHGDGVLVIPDVFNGQVVSGIAREGFKDCTVLTGLTLPRRLTVIGEDAFNGCIGLQSVTVPDGVVSLGKDAFKKCTNLKLITLPVSLKTVGAHAFVSAGLIRITYTGTRAQWDAITFHEKNEELFALVEDGGLVASDTVAVDDDWA